MKKIFKTIAVALLGATALFSCTNLDIRMPKGPQGEQGIPGRDGLSAYEVWVKAVHDGIIEYPGGTEINDFFIYLKGKDGKDGKDGLTPFIGEDGNWHIGDQNTGVPAKGQDGLTPQVANGKDGIPQWIFVKGQNDTVWTGVPAVGKDGKDGKDGADGKDGLSAYEIWKISVAEGIEDPKNPGQDWPKDKTSIANFYEFLTGNDGDNGLVPYIGDNGNWFIGTKDTGVPAKGKDGLNGTDGKSAYEIWKALAQTGNLDDPHNPGAKWDKTKVSVDDFWVYLSGVDGKDGANGTNGKDGKDGLTPTIGDNGNWFIGNTDTGVPAQGADGVNGKDGATPTIGANGNWFIGTTDTGVPAKGKDGANGSNGKDGLSAYELWVKDVTSAAGLEDPHNPGTNWDPAKTTLADFWQYLQGKDGKDGVDGKSAYELWKEIVDQGKMDNPKTDDETDFWPTENNTIEWFWEYLKGKDGKDATAAVIAGADKTKFNLVPMPAVKNADGVDEYVNPFTGGVTYRACAPNYVVLANCNVDIPMPDGTTLTLSTDINGYTHLPVDKLPDWSTGAPAGGMAIKPSKFTLSDGTVINDANNIAQTCNIPYKVKTEVSAVINTYSPELNVNSDFQGNFGIVTVQFEIERTVEGITKAVDFSTMKYYVLNGSKTIDMTKSIYDRLGSGYTNDNKKAYFKRESETYNDNLKFGNGPTGPTVDYTNDVSLTSSGYWPKGWIPDYGCQSEDDVIFEVPLINPMGGFLYEDPANPKIKLTVYKLFTGYADFDFVLDLDSFGGTYVNYNDDRNGTGNATRQDTDGVYKFKYFSSLKALMNDTEYKNTVSRIHSRFRNSGTFNGTKIDNTISFSNEAFDMNTPVTIKNVYNDFEIEFFEFTNTSNNNILYLGKYGTFNTVMAIGTPSSVNWNGEASIEIQTVSGE